MAAERERARFVCVWRGRCAKQQFDDKCASIMIEARRRGVPVAQVVREAVEHHLPAPEPGRPLSFFAVGAGGPAGASERVDEYVLRAARRRRRS